MDMQIRRYRVYDELGFYAETIDVKDDQIVHAMAARGWDPQKCSAWPEKKEAHA